VDVKKGLVGISAKKVEWLETWIGEVLDRRSVLGRDMRSALGRMGFLAGPLKHSRPFLALIYRWTSKIGAGSFTAIPLAAQLTLRFFLEAIKAAPLRAPRAVPRPGGEIFRVDAKADAGVVSIGGWESFSGCPPNRARWFSVELTRKNAPWIYVKGEAFQDYLFPRAAGHHRGHYGLWAWGQMEGFGGKVGLDGLYGQPDQCIRAGHIYVYGVPRLGDPHGAGHAIAGQAD